MTNVWSRSFRRRKQQKGNIGGKDQGDDIAAGAEEIDDEEATLGFGVQLRYDNASRDNVVVVIRWLKGNDSVLFESFCGMLKRTLDMRESDP